jgi:hypothetical protein
MRSKSNYSWQLRLCRENIAVGAGLKLALPYLCSEKFFLQENVAVINLEMKNLRQSIRENVMECSGTALRPVETFSPDKGADLRIKP